MLEDSVAEDLVDGLPVARDQALLVEVDKVAFDLLCGGGGMISACEVVANLVALDLLQAVAEGLQLLELTFAQQLFDYLGQQVDVFVLVVEAMLFAHECGQV